MTQTYNGPFRIFIGYERKQEMAFQVLAYSIRKYTSIPVSITALELSKLPMTRAWDPLQSTEFTYSRFLVPYLCGYEGTALFIDVDMICLADMAEIAAMDMKGLALRVVKHEHNPTTQIKLDGRVQTRYPRKNWSSMMLMNCSELKVWSREAVDTQTGAFLHRFDGIPDEKIGDIPFGWNDLDEALSPKTKLLHYTEGGPWLPNYRDVPWGKVWLEHYNELLHQMDFRKDF